ncbi:hypothetical protein BGZ83_004244, partial [Gryganskiella cystojenkinii]
MVSPPVDFRALGPMAILGDFDGLTPVITQGQQNAFESHTFSILEMVNVPAKQPSSSQSSVPPPVEGASILSVPVLLASFLIEGGSRSSSTEDWIKATCVLNSAPHQVYIGGYFKQILSSSTSSSYDAAVATSNNTNSTSGNAGSNNAMTGLNYIGMYDSKLKRFLALHNGLDGPVHDLLCDSSVNQVFVVGQFRGPLPDEVISTSSSGISNPGSNGADYSSNG